MSIGLAILLSVLTLIAAWQIDKHAAWGKLWRFGRWLAGIGLLAAVMFYLKASDERELREQARVVREQARVVRAGQLSEYWGIKLGDNKNEVLYLKGEPSERRQKGDDDSWVYSNDEGWRMVDWSRRGTVVMIVCVSRTGLGCDPIAGVRIGTLEQQVRQALGQPTEESGPDENGGKRLVYGTNERDVRFWLRQGAVEVIAVREASE
jgi:hypothetical protein